MVDLFHVLFEQRQVEQFVVVQTLGVRVEFQPLAIGIQCLSHNVCHLISNCSTVGFDTRRLARW